jgi:hypothetical protein
MEKKNKFKCDICNKIITQKNFRRVLVHNILTEYHDLGVMDNCEKQIDCCNKCILELNFKQISESNQKMIESVDFVTKTVTIDKDSKVVYVCPMCGYGYKNKKGAMNCCVGDE